MDEFGLQFLEPRLGLLALGKVAYETGKEALVAGFHLADVELDGKRRAVPAFADDNPADADNSPLARPDVALQVAVVTLPIRRRHQHFHVFSENLVGAIAEQPLRRRAERLHSAAVVNDDHGIRDGVENRFDMGFPGERLLGACRRRKTRTTQQIAAPRRAAADQREYESIDNVGAHQCAIIGDEKQADQQAKNSGEGARAPSAEGRRDQNRRNEEQVRRGSFEHRLQCDANDQRQRNRKERNTILFNAAARSRDGQRHPGGVRTWTRNGFSHYTTADRRIFGRFYGPAGDCRLFLPYGISLMDNI